MAADVWEKDVWEIQAKSGSSGSCPLFLHFLGKTPVQKMSGRTPGSPRHPSSRHPRSSDICSLHITTSMMLTLSVSSLSGSSSTPLVSRYSCRAKLVSRFSPYVFAMSHENRATPRKSVSRKALSHPLWGGCRTLSWIYKKESCRATGGVAATVSRVPLHCDTKSPSHNLSKCHISPGKISVSGPLLQESQSDTFPREISDFVTQNIFWAASGGGRDPQNKTQGEFAKSSS